MREFNGLDDLRASVGTSLGTSDWHTVTQEQVNLFADATGLTARREQQRWLNRRDKRRRETVEKLHTPHASDGRRVQRHDPTVDDKR